MARLPKFATLESKRDEARAEVEQLRARTARVCVACGGRGMLNSVAVDCPKCGGSGGVVVEKKT